MYFDLNVNPCVPDVLDRRGEPAHIASLERGHFDWTWRVHTQPSHLVFLFGSHQPDPLALAFFTVQL